MNFIAGVPEIYLCSLGIHDIPYRSYVINVHCRR